MVSEGVVSSPIIISFLIFIAVNFPANHIIDTRGTRVSFLIGLTLYTLGLFAFCLVNHGYGWAIIGTIIVSFGQPFVLNCPAKIATFWFFPKNVKNNRLLAHTGHCNHGGIQHIRVRAGIRNTDSSRNGRVKGRWRKAINYAFVCWVRDSFQRSTYCKCNLHESEAEYFSEWWRISLKAFVQVICANG